MQVRSQTWKAFTPGRFLGLNQVPSRVPFKKRWNYLEGSDIHSCWYSEDVAVFILLQFTLANLKTKALIILQELVLSAFHFNINFHLWWFFILSRKYLVFWMHYIVWMRKFCRNLFGMLHLAFWRWFCKYHILLISVTKPYWNCTEVLNVILCSSFFLLFCFINTYFTL